MRSALHSRNSNTDWMTEYRSGYWLRPGRVRNHGSITSRVERLSLFPNFQTSFVSRPVSPPVGTCGVLHGVKTALAGEGVNMTSYIPIRMYGVHRESFTFTVMVVILRPMVDEQLSVSQEGTCFVKVKMELKLFLCTHEYVKGSRGIAHSL